MTFLRLGVLLVGVLVSFAVKQALVFLAADFTRGSPFTVFFHVPLRQTPKAKSFTFNELDSLFVCRLLILLHALRVCLLLQYRHGS